MPFCVMPRDGVTKIEHSFQFVPDQRPTEEISQPSKWERVLDFIFKDASVFPIGLDSVCVLPMSEGAANLNIAELATRNEASVLSDPPQADWTVSYS
jgi:hypothetical protein